MVETIFKNKGIKITADGSVPLFDVRDPILADPKQPFVHRHLSDDSAESYYIYGGNQKIGIDVPKAVAPSSFYLKVDKNGEVFFPSFSCTITYSQPPVCKAVPPQIEIFTNSGYWIYSGGVEICSDLCFERMKQSLGRYYSLPQKTVPPPMLPPPLPAVASTAAKEAPTYEKGSVDLLKKVIEDPNSDFMDQRLLAYASLAELPFPEAVDLLIDQFSQSEAGSSEESALALALCRVPKFLRSADRIVLIHSLKTKRPAEVEMILKSWGISLETPVPEEIISQYGPLPNPPPHPVTLEWLADEMDNRLKKMTHIGRQTEGRYALSSSIRDVIGLQGILYPLTIFMQGLESKELRNAIGKYLEADFKDGMTEYGVFFTYEKNQVQPHLLAPAQWGNNYKYQPPPAAFHLPDTKGFLFLGHLHSLPSSEKYAGPSRLGHHLEGDMWGTSQIVITRLKDGEFNVDWYDHQYGVLDLGIYSYALLEINSKGE